MREPNLERKKTGGKGPRMLALYILVLLLTPALAVVNPELLGYVSSVYAFQCVLNVLLDLRQSAGLATSTSRYAAVTAHFSEDIFVSLQCNQDTASIPIQLDLCPDASPNCVSFERTVQRSLTAKTTVQSLPFSVSDAHFHL